MRIVAGRFGGRVLRAPPGMTTRPTSERVRQAIFNVLGDPPENCHILDLFAGSGAMGLEALSRGAVHATFVDNGRQALQALRNNLDTLQVAANQVTIKPLDAVRAVTERPTTPWHWVFIDPPYRTDLATQAALVLPAASLTADATVIIEHDRRNEPTATLGVLTLADQRRYGDTVVSYYRVQEVV